MESLRGPAANFTGASVRHALAGEPEVGLSELERAGAVAAQEERVQRAYLTRSTHIRYQAVAQLKAEGRRDMRHGTALRIPVKLALFGSS